MKYIEDDETSLKESAAQTENDSLVDHVKVVNPTLNLQWPKKLLPNKPF